MIGSILAVVALVALILYFVLKATKKKQSKPLLELRSDPALLHNLHLQPGNDVTLKESKVAKEVHVFAKAGGEVRLGTLTQRFVYDKVLKNEILAKIYSIKGDTLTLELLSK